MQLQGHYGFVLASDTIHPFEGWLPIPFGFLKGDHFLHLHAPTFPPFRLHPDIIHPRDFLASKYYSLQVPPSPPPSHILLNLVGSPSLTSFSHQGSRCCVHTSKDCARVSWHGMKGTISTALSFTSLIKILNIYVSCFTYL